MRANSPTTNDIGSLLRLPTEDERTPLEKLTREELDLAKAAKSANGQIILQHLQRRVDNFTTQLKSQKVEGDHVVALAKVMAAQVVIEEFEGVINESRQAIKAVEDAAKKS
jgi:hypothetical protein